MQHGHDCIVPTNRKHVSWIEFRVMNKGRGIPLSQLQRVWKTTPWCSTPNLLHVTAAVAASQETAASASATASAEEAASDRVSWNDFQSFFRGKKSRPVRVVRACGRNDLNCWLTPRHAQKVQKLWEKYRQGLYSIDLNSDASAGSAASDDDAASASDDIPSSAAAQKLARSER